MDTPTDRHAGTRATTTHAGVTIAWRWCPAGTVMLGSPPEEEGRDDDEAQHPFTTPGYWLTETLITQAQYRAVMGESPSFFRGDDRPVERVSWHDARRFCEAIGARLPTEDEWEYASRAGTTGPRYGAIDDVAVWRRSYAHGTAPVRSKAPNAWGLYEPLGNVWEWTESEYPGTSRRVIRGGSWSDNVASWVRVAFRSSAAVSVRNSGVGFRCARSELPAEPAPRFGLHAAGAASRQAEVDALREVDRLKDERAAEGAALREPRLLESLERAHAREAQLTRERDEALATVELSQQTIEEQAGARRVVEREVARLIAELARARELYPIVEQELNDLRAYQAQRVADARAEGAREEREANHRDSHATRSGRRST